ncbi:MAG: aminotransferase class III-fold pyridoxal phosphate-dependent enzyme [Acidobacteriaceae bacterium]|nr:aminotransferase class III-fold pyridoxal phosphate-dependent enzyme [Acidobacteriaceae bacterium]MBV9779412.1 aminotransferase class III-fold pyridoxal phosphate-dependent enzyme [Acidobacteriaceae bacterium]
MYPALEKELETYQKRTPKSRKAHERASNRVPIGVGSNYRYYPPYPLSVRDGKGSRIHDIDGNEYLDHNLCYGALFAGHCHPAVMKAVEKRLRIGTLFGMPHGLELELAEEICARFPVEMVRFGSSGSEITMHSLRLARAVTGRSKIIKMEGGYHGGHDAVSVSVKPKEGQFGDPEHPTAVVSSLGVLKGTADATLVAPFNNLPAVEDLFAENPDDIAAVLVEPIMMNIGICMPDEGYLPGLRDITRRYGAMFIMDEVKTGGKLAYGGACEYFNVKPDIVCLGKSIGGGFPLAAFGASREVMEVIAKQKMFHAGTYNTNPVVMAAGLATFREVLTREAFEHVSKLNQKLLDGYQQTIKKAGLIAYAEGAGANGALMFYPHRIRNYRDWYHIDEDLWTHYWFAMTNRGVLSQPYWWDEQWTISVQHTEADIDEHLEVFADIAPALAAAQEERMTVGPLGTYAS